MIAGVIDTIKTIQMLQDKMNYSDVQIAKYLGMKTQQLREFRLNYRVLYRSDDIKNNDYLTKAIEFNNLASEVYFPIELARMTNTSPYTTNMICKMFNVKPTKKAYCKYCGKELTVKSTAVPQYCNASCRYKYKGDVQC